MAILPIDSGRYGTARMLAVFGEQKKIQYQLDIEGAVASAQAKIGMIPAAAGADILRASRSGRVTASRVKRIERTTDHDTAALVQALGEACRPKSRPWIHYGLTSNDLVDTSTSLQMRDALNIISPGIAGLARRLASMAKKHAAVPAVGRTHGQHASVISFGLKFAVWADELLAHLERIDSMRGRALVCKTLGVVGTGSLMGARALDVQKRAAAALGLLPVRAASQVVARERYAEYSFVLALAGSTLDKMATEVRNLQRTEIGEVAEHFGAGQMGSSAVPVKRNPVKSERVSSLAKVLRSQVQIGFENISLWHERDLSNSAAERFTIPTSSVLLDEMTGTMDRVMSGLRVSRRRISENLSLTRGQIYAEFVLEALIKKGMPRMTAYRHVQRVAFAAHESGSGYLEALSSDRAVSAALSRRELERVFDPSRHLGASAKIISAVHAAAMARRA